MRSLEGCQPFGEWPHGRGVYLELRHARLQAFELAS